MPEKLDDEKLSRALHGTRVALEGLFGVSLAPEAPAITSMVGRTLTDVADAAGEGKLECATYSLGRADGLVSDLATLKQARPDLFAELRPRLLRGPEAQYFGTRCELGVAVDLVRAGVVFRRGRPGEDPDFVCQEDAVGIECTSSHVGGTARPVREKVVTAIQKKAMKPYNNSNTVLVLDFTNVVFNDAEDDAMSEGATADLRAALAATRFGALLTLLSGVKGTSFSRIYGRFEGPQPSDGVQRFLDKYHPKTTTGGVTIAIPRSG